MLSLERKAQIAKLAEEADKPSPSQLAHPERSVEVGSNPSGSGTPPFG